MKKPTEEQAYEENVGHPPRNLPPDHPHLWQWLYRGTRAERATLLERLAGEPLTTQEEALW